MKTITRLKKAIANASGYDYRDHLTAMGENSVINKVTKLMLKDKAFLNRLLFDIDLDMGGEIDTNKKYTLEIGIVSDYDSGNYDTSFTRFSFRFIQNKNEFMNNYNYIGKI